MLRLSVFFLLVLANISAKASSPIVILTGNTMGTYYQVRFVGLPPSPVAEKIESIFESINQKMSTYIADSDLMKFNRNSSTDWIPVDKQLLEVALISKKAFSMSQGAFDPSVGAIVELWGFGSELKLQTSPDEKELANLVERVGYERLLINQETSSLKKEIADLDIDFSGVAKGYAIDLVADYLESLGIENYLVEVGGDLKTRGEKPDNSLWSIAVERPDSAQGSVLQVIYPRNFAVATSGDYRNYFEADGKRFSHLIDPRSGYPIGHKLASVSVASRTCAESDALATAAMVLGYEKSRDLAERHKIGMLWVLRKDEGFEIKTNQYFDPLLSSEALKGYTE